MGAEEQAPSVADIQPLAKALGLPAFPLILPQIVPLPLPVKYRMWFGEPMYFEGDPEDDDDIVSSHVKKVKHTIQRMLQHGLEQRERIFS